MLARQLLATNDHDLKTDHSFSLNIYREIVVVVVAEACLHTAALSISQFVNELPSLRSKLHCLLAM